MSEIILQIAAIVGVLIGWPLGVWLAEWQVRRAQKRAVRASWQRSEG